MTNSTSSSKQNGRAPIHTPDPEVVPRATRRRFSAWSLRYIHTTYKIKSPRLPPGSMIIP
jgi:hypothetical protein